jgi:putative ABC transport system ATP-binding protein
LSTNASPLIRAERLSKTFRLGSTEVQALADIDVTIERSEFAVMLGPSGCGKTTFLNLVGGMQKPTSGSLLVDGEEIATLDDNALTEYRRRKIGFIFQFFNLVPTLTVRENVELAADLVEQPRPIDEVLSAVGLADRAESFPSELSGGEQQRVAAARAVVKNPTIVLCDEATGNLDATTGRGVLRMLRDINRSEKCTIVFVTHNAAIAAMADRVIRMGSGRVESVERQPAPASPDDLRW